jgi:hypothetical protein
MEVCYWALLFMPLVILHHLLNVFVQLANKRGFTKKKKKIPELFTCILLLALLACKTSQIKFKEPSQKRNNCYLYCALETTRRKTRIYELGKQAKQ